MSAPRLSEVERKALAIETVERCLKYGWALAWSRDREAGYNVGTSGWNTIPPLREQYADDLTGHWRSAVELVAGKISRRLQEQNPMIPSSVVTADGADRVLSISFDVDGALAADLFRSWALPETFTTKSGKPVGYHCHFAPPEGWTGDSAFLVEDELDEETDEPTGKVKVVGKRRQLFCAPGGWHGKRNVPYTLARDVRPAQLTTEMLEPLLALTGEREHLGAPADFDHDREQKTRPRLAAVLALLEAKRNERGWQAPCPAHKHPGQSPTSLLVFPGDHVEVGFHCSAGCSPDEIRASDILRGVFGDSPLSEHERKPASLSGKRVPAGGISLLALLQETRAFFRRFVVVDDLQANAIALWVPHTYVYDAARATPYLNFWSPEPGSGKTTALEVLEAIVRAGQTADDLTGASMFRLIHSLKPTLLFDEVDAVFQAKKHSETTADLLKVLNSGYRAGKRIYRMGGPRMSELMEFDPYCPKATAGLKELPGTLAHRSIPIAMQPPLPTDHYEDFDPEEIEDAAASLREGWQAWAEGAIERLRDHALKPPKLEELDARRNEIWRILFRIADLAGGDWPESAHTAAVELSSGYRRNDEASTGIKLLAAIRDLFSDEKMPIKKIAEQLNADEALSYGDWNDGKGINTRELGKELAPYGIHAKPIRIDGKRAGNGYEKAQFEDAWARYLLSPASETSTTGTSVYSSQELAENKPVQDGAVPVSEKAANPHEQSDVPLVPVVVAGGTENGKNDRPLMRDDGFLENLFAAFEAGHLVEEEWREAERAHRFLVAVEGRS